MDKPNTTCLWIILSKSRRPIRITFSNKIKLDDDAECTQNQIKLYNGPGRLFPVLGTYCKDIPTIQTTSAYLTLKYTTKTSSPGFSAIITEITHDCSDENIILTEDQPKGTISSPGYSNRKFYPVSLECIWIIRAPHGRRIRLDFNQSRTSIGNVKESPVDILSHLTALPAM